MLQYNLACIGQDGNDISRIFPGYLDDGPALAKGEPPYGIQVIDCGCRTDVTAGATIYVCSGRVWQRQEKVLAGKHDPRGKSFLTAGSRAVCKGAKETYVFVSMAEKSVSYDTGGTKIFFKNDREGVVM